MLTVGEKYKPICRQKKKYSQFGDDVIIQEFVHYSFIFWDYIESSFYNCLC